MAKKSVVFRNLKREKMAANHAEKRTKLKKMAIDPKLSIEERYEARKKLQDMPMNGAPCRVNVRCSITGRSRGVYRKFRLSRIKFRELALQGMIPGVTKSSW